MSQGSHSPDDSKIGRRRAAPRARRWATWSILLTFALLGCQVLFGNVEVIQHEAGLCTAGDFRCNGEYLLSCGSKDTGWALKDTCPSGDLCSAKTKRCAVCKDGDFRCDQADRQQCAADGSGWTTVQHCPSEEVCSESSCNGCSTDGALDCSLDTKLRQCKDGVWLVLDNCASQALCNDTMITALTAVDWSQKCNGPICTAGSYRCEGSTLERCPPEQDQWQTVDTCASENLCNAAVAKVSVATSADAGNDPNAAATLDMCTPGCPTPGAFVCEGTQLEQCRPDQVGYDIVKVCDPSTECDPVLGDCGLLCTPGHFQCNGATLRKCATNGHWADLTACETAGLCTASADGTTGSCTPSPCGNNPYRCKGATLQKCKEDRTDYQDSKTCASGPLCEATSGRCLDPICPTAGAYQCFGQDLKQCSTDLTTWNEVKLCPTGQFCSSETANPGCMTSCPANPVRCNGKVLETCSAAMGWVTKATCATTDLCNCTQTSPQSCALGVAKDGCGSAACGGSLPTFRCQAIAPSTDKNELQKCQAGRNGWDNVAACGADPFPPNHSFCFAGTSPAFADGYCLTCPVAGETACNGKTGILRTCSADRRTWISPKTCGADGCVALNLANDYCAACSVGEKQCVGAALQTCNSAQTAFATTQTCASAALCDGTKLVCNPKACSAGDKQCVGAQLQTCKADLTGFATTQTCASAALCDTTKLVCNPKACSAGDKQCVGAQLQTCKADLTGFATTQTCASAALCNGTTLKCDAPTCTAGQKQCAGAVPQTCNSNLNGWVSGTACAAGCNATMGICNGCLLGQHQCKAANSQVCSADQSGFVAPGTACGAPNCNATTGLCNACSVGQLRCSGSSSQVCSADQSGFVAPGTACGAPGCNPASGACFACAPGQAKCVGAVLEICAADRSGFGGGTTCAAGCDAGTNSCSPVLICALGDRNCNGLTLQTCNSTRTGWTNVQTCTLTCDKTAGCTECVASTASCAGNVLQTCSTAGHLLPPLNCLTNVCNPAGAGSCDPPAGGGGGGGGAPGGVAGGPP